MSDEQMVMFGDEKLIDHMLNKSDILETKLQAWMEVNKRHPKAKNLMYNQFSTKFVWKLVFKVFTKILYL